MIINENHCLSKEMEEITPNEIQKKLNKTNWSLFVFSIQELKAFYCVFGMRSVYNGPFAWDEMNFISRRLMLPLARLSLL